jgi:hypothetical protein
MQRRVEVVEVGSDRGRDARDFIELPYRLYRSTPQWVPQFRSDVRRLLARRDPFFRTAAACCLVARRDGRAVGTLACFDNARYNEYHRAHLGTFHFFDCEDDPEAAAALFEAGFAWMRGRGLASVRGPMGYGLLGTGILIEGFEHRAAMTMMPYNFPYYRGLVEGVGFAKYRDQLSAQIAVASFRLPEKVRRVAEIALKRGTFTVPDIRTKRELVRRARDIGRVYNDSFASHGEDYLPMTDEEIGRAAGGLAAVADPRLVKLLLHGEELAGFLLGFPDLSPAIRRSGGRMTPWALARLRAGYRTADTLIVNGAGVAGKYQRLGGTALLYATLERIGRERRFRWVDCVQITETTELMLADLVTLGARIHKRHRVYQREL